MRTAFLALLTTVFAINFLGASSASADATSPLRYLPVQDAGRVKPLETLARESLQLIYGSQNFRSQDGKKRPALETVMTWMLVPTFWDSQAIIEINHRGLKESLNLPSEKKYYSPAELFANGRLVLVMQELASYRETKKKLDPYYQAASRLESQLGQYQAIKLGTALRIAPPKPVVAAPDPNAIQTASERWISASELDGDLKEKFAEVARAFVHALPKEAKAGEPAQADDPTAEASLQSAVDNFKAAARAQNPELYPSDRSMNIEVHYESFHPFMWAWIFYLLGAVVLGIAWQTSNANWTKAGWAFALIAFSLHIYGFILRIYLTGRPPVSNMYESVVWVSFGVVVFSMIFEYLNRKKFILLAGCSIAVLCLVVADLAPAILDKSVQPLEPVLRSNMWLTIHVLTITLSYSAYFLAWGLGNIGLFFILRGDRPTDERPRAFSHSIYRAIQVGVVLLAAGTILGGIWADYSWGRFWGWDPKETWAFIALMGYLALLHARLTGWVQNFGMLVFSVVAFNLVIMAWYGVNFVLGAGLHAYGFGAGGVEYVGAFVALDLIYVGFVCYVKMERARVAKNLTPKS